MEAKIENLERRKDVINRNGIENKIIFYIKIYKIFFSL